jgi:hypothetical protein
VAEKQSHNKKFGRKMDKEFRFRCITITRRLKGHYWIVGRIGEHCTAVMVYKETFALQESNKEMYFAT